MFNHAHKHGLGGVGCGGGIGLEWDRNQTNMVKMIFREVPPSDFPKKILILHVWSGIILEIT